jgi:hypothetical protein
MTLWQRIRYAMVRPDDEDTKASTPPDRTVEELEEAIQRADDKERAIGLVAAPVAAIIGIVIGNASVSYAKDHHQGYHVFAELTYVLMGLSVLILVTAWWRKRLFLGITLALYGLAVFNLRYWGFGIPFVLAGAWYLVRAYRLQQELKRAEAAGGGGTRTNGRSASNGARPRPNKRYTPKN